MEKLRKQLAKLNLSKRECFMFQECGGCSEPTLIRFIENHADLPTDKDTDEKIKFAMSPNSEFLQWLKKARKK